MEAPRLLERLCARHGLSLDDARALLPLVERALTSPEDVRERLLALIDENLRRKAGGTQEASLDQLKADLDDEVLRAVAQTLHNWEPSKRVQGMDAGPEEFDSSQVNLADHDPLLGHAEAEPEEEDDGADLPDGFGF